MGNLLTFPLPTNVTKPNFYSPQPVAKGKYDGQGIKCFLGGAQSDFCMLGTGS